MSVGVRELKEHLSEYVDRAARGEVIQVTDRGRPRAVLAPLPGTSRVEEGIREGWIHRERIEPPRPVKRQRARLSITAALDDDRGDP